MSLITFLWLFMSTKPCTLKVNPAAKLFNVLCRVLRLLRALQYELRDTPQLRSSWGSLWLGLRKAQGIGIASRAGVILLGSFVHPEIRRLPL